ncbi:MAG: hypothetical protein DI628_00845 [Blastochloris viridis]|uniref:Polysaccharide biosynthesis protein n=1 Tax=Blastochloris viridis TaxID=1079 RepID=A0A6N4RDK0_BLAVI|nr:MAG: hypothetical protein DI628_00845 [Blastochloris viridis]
MMNHVFELVNKQFRSPARRQLMFMLMATVTGSALTLVVQMVLGMLLPPDEFGEIRLIWGYFLLAAPFVLLGVVAPLGRLAISPRSHARRLLYWRETLRWWRIPGVIVTLGLAGFSLMGWITVNPTLMVPLAVMMLSVPLWCMTDLYQTFWKFIRARNMASIGLFVAKLGLLVGLLLVWLRPFETAALNFSSGYVLGMLGAVLGLHLMHGRATATLEPCDTHDRLNAREWGVVKRFMPVALIANVVNVLAVQMDVILMDRFAIDPHEVGLYLFAMMFAATVLLVQDPVISFLLPELGTVNEREPERLARKVLVYQAALSGFMLMMAVAMVVVVPYLITWFFDEAYRDASRYLPYVGLVAVVQGSMGILYQGLFVRNQMHLSTLFTMIATLIALCTAVLLMPHYGLWGLIIGKLTGGVVFAVLGITALLRFQGVKMHDN